jgi:hypothetical protein
MYNGYLARISEHLSDLSSSGIRVQRLMFQCFDDVDIFYGQPLGSLRKGFSVAVHSTASYVVANGANG